MIFHGQCCQACLQQIINIHIYIENAKNNAKICNYYLSQLDIELNAMESKLYSEKSEQLAQGLIILVDPCVKESVDNKENISQELKSKKKQFTCDCCKKQFTSKIALIWHLQKKAKKCTELEKFTCQRCGSSFNSREGLTKHVQCEICATEPMQQSTSGIKPNLLLFKQKNCIQCRKLKCDHEIFINAVQIQMKIKKLHSVKCPECSFTIPVKSNTVMSHMLRHANLVHLKKPAQICDKCGKYLYGVNEYSCHLIERHSPKHLCPYCDKYFLMHEFEKHVALCKKLKRSFNCNSCQASFSSHSCLKRHLRKHQEMPIVALSCELCNYQTVNNEHFSKHMKMYHSIIPRRKMQNKKTNEKCSICLFQFKNRKEYPKHMKGHGIDGKLMCQVCFLHFETLEEKQLHNKTNEHLEKCSYKCEECPFATYSQNLLISHVNREHKKISPYICEYCSKSFVSNVNLINHRNRVHTKNFRTYECSYCYKVIGCLSGLRRHIVRFHETDKLMKCPHCDRAYSTESEIKCHILKTHSKIKNVFCPLCSSSFFAVMNLRMHLQKVHWKSKEKFDFRKLEGLTEQDIKFLRDRRRGLMEEMNDYAVLVNT